MHEDSDLVARTASSMAIVVEACDIEAVADICKGQNDHWVTLCPCIVSVLIELQYLIPSSGRGWMELD